MWIAPFATYSLVTLGPQPVAGQQWMFFDVPIRLESNPGVFVELCWDNCLGRTDQKGWKIDADPLRPGGSHSLLGATLYVQGDPQLDQGDPAGAGWYEATATWGVFYHQFLSITFDTTDGSVADDDYVAQARVEVKVWDNLSNNQYVIATYSGQTADFYKNRFVDIDLSSLVVNAQDTVDSSPCGAYLQVIIRCPGGGRSLDATINQPANRPLPDFCGLGPAP